MRPAKIDAVKAATDLFVDEAAVSDDTDNPFVRYPMLEEAWRRMSEAIRQRIEGTEGNGSMRDAVTAFHTAAMQPPALALLPMHVAACMLHFVDCPWRPLSTLAADIRSIWTDATNQFAEASRAKTEVRARAATLYDPWQEPKPQQWPVGILS